MDIRPERGGRITSLRLRGEELLDQGIGVDQPTAEGFVNGGAWGWDEMVPTVEATGSLSDHGEAWRVPWAVISQDSISCVMSCEGRALPWRLERSIQLAAAKQLKEQFDPDGVYIRIDGAALEPGRAVGAIATSELEASWDLRFEDPNEPFHHLPYDRLYEARLPRTKFLSPYPSARFEGSVTVGGERIELSRWPGMIGHNWGAEHAERWVWIQGADLGGQEGTCLDLAAGRIKVGPLTTPWVANGLLRIDGVEHRLGGFDRVMSTKLDETPTSCAFQISGKEVKLRGRVSGEPRNFVAWVYADPKGPEHNTLNCSISDLELELERGGRSERLELHGGAAYEIGMRPTDHGIPLQPYPDG